jgi:hypothetical protein
LREFFRRSKNGISFPVIVDMANPVFDVPAGYPCHHAELFCFGQTEIRRILGGKKAGLSVKIDT